MNTVQPRTKAAPELIVLQERRRPTSQKRLVSFHRSSLRKEATPRHRLKEEARNGRWPQSQSLERWPHWTSHPFGTPPLQPVAVARCCTPPGLWPLLRPPSAVYPLFLRGLDASRSGWMSSRRMTSQSIRETLPGDPCPDCFSLQTCFGLSRYPPGAGELQGACRGLRTPLQIRLWTLRVRKHGLSTSSEAGRVWLQPTVIPPASRPAGN